MVFFFSLTVFLKDRSTDYELIFCTLQSHVKQVQNRPFLVEMYVVVPQTLLS